MAKKKKHEEHENHERWLVSYADFITLLFAFFVVMYSVSSVNEGKLRAAADAISQAFNPLVNLSASPVRIDPKITSQLPNVITPDFKVYQKIKEALEEAGEGLTGKVEVSVEKRGIVIRVAETVIFDTGKAEIREDALDVLGKVGGILADLDNQVRVEGHTDNVPIKTARYPSNWELSTDRASTIVRHFIDRVKMEPSRLSAGGYAEYRPVDGNGSPEGRARNRRVDIVILNEQEAALEPL
jgi:chemotaxis protein MotB